MSTILAPTFYPSTTDIAKAATVSSSSGGELRGFDIKMISTLAFVVSGTVVGSDGQPVARAAVKLIVWPTVVPARTLTAVIDVPSFAADRWVASVLSGRDGTETRRLVDLPTSDINPQWSPDGKSIYFVSPLEGPADDSGGFHVIDVGSRKITRVAAAGNWHNMQGMPDGTRLLAHESGPPDTKVLVTPGGKSQTVLVRQPGTTVLVTPNGKSRTPFGEIGTDACFSPDSRELYSRTGSPDKAIWALRVSDGVRRKILGSDGDWLYWPPPGTVQPSTICPAVCCHFCYHSDLCYANTRRAAGIISADTGEQPLSSPSRFSSCGIAVSIRKERT